MPLPAMPRTPWPKDLPERWWERSTEDVERLFDAVRWRPETPSARDGDDLERLLRHHPLLVPGMLDQQLSTRLAWRSTPEAPVHTVLWHALELCPADTVIALHVWGSVLNEQERAQVGNLQLAVVHTGRNLPADSPLHRLPASDRLVREQTLLGRLAQLGVAPLIGDDPGEVVRLAAKLGLPDTTLHGLIEHGVDVNAPPASTLSNTPLREIAAHGGPEELERWLTLGLAFSQGPGDDQAALSLLGWTLPRSDESPAQRVARQAGLLEVLHRHGWTPGPVFQARALGVSARHGNDPGLLPVLAAWGARPDGRDAHGRTALHHASTLPQSLPNVAPLLAMGADPQAQDHHGASALDAAREHAGAYQGAREAFATAITAMETSVLRATLASTPDVAPAPPSPTGPRSRL